MAFPDATALAERVRRREETPSELVEAAIARLEAVEPRLRAVTQPLFARARRRAAQIDPDQGAFPGVPFLLKDLDGFLAGTPTIAGSRFFRDAVAARSSTLVERYEAAGLVPIAKTSCPELGIYPTTEPALFGPTHNPWDPRFTPGGSSGGSAALVAARVVPMAHGGDGGGSIRIPASCCGLFGLKPSRGRMPLGPQIAQGWGGLVVPHVITISVRDAAGALDATAGADPGAPYAAPAAAGPWREEVGRDPGRLRIAWSARNLFGTSTHPTCAAAVAEAAALLQDLGHEVEEAHPAFDRQRLVRAFLGLVAAGTAAAIADGERQLGRRARRGDLELSTRLLARIGATLTAAEHELDQQTALLAARDLAPFFGRYDLLLTPTLAHPPQPLGAFAPTRPESILMRVLQAVPARRLLLAALDEMAANAFELTGNTMLFNLTGGPAASVPLAWSPSGLPIGIQLAADLGREDLVLRTAAQLEAARPWADRVPPIAAAATGL